MFILGVFAFCLLFLSDLNDLRFHRRGLIFLFPAGAAALTAAVLISLDLSAAPLSGPLPLTLGWLALAFFAALEVYTLFFAFPAADGYAKPGEKRKVCDSGVYALCRHPGVLWLAFVLLFLWLCAGLPPLHVLAYTALNAALVAFEDAFVFPALIEGYDRYKLNTPFLLPTAASMGLFLRRGNLTK